MHGFPKKYFSPVWLKCCTMTIWRHLRTPWIDMWLLGRMNKGFSYEIESLLCVILSMHGNLLASFGPPKDSHAAIRPHEKIPFLCQSSVKWQQCVLRVQYSYGEVRVEMGPTGWLSAQMQHMLWVGLVECWEGERRVAREGPLVCLAATASSSRLGLGTCNEPSAHGMMRAAASVQR